MLILPRAENMDSLTSGLNHLTIRILSNIRSKKIFSKIRLLLRAYSFGHLKPAKSSENGRLCREKCQKNTDSENGRVGRLRKEKCQKNGNGMLKK